MIAKNSFTLQENKVGRWAKFHKWNRKWNKIMSIVFCVLTFALLFAIVMVNTALRGNEEQTRDALTKSYESKCVLYLTSNSSGDMCDVYCFRSFNLIEEVEAAIFNDKICSEIGYHLRYDEPRTSKIGPGWFKVNATINKITIRDDQYFPVIAEIEPGAFDDCTFRKMTELVIRRTNITILKRGMFEGANSLKKLTFEQNIAMQEAEENVLDPLYQLEEMIMTQQPQFENSMNLTGAARLNRLCSLSLTLNNFSSSINANTFKGCVHVQTLRLASSSIQTIGDGSFDHMMETIMLLDLSNNQLKHLSPDLLANLIKPNMKIYFQSNLLDCGCDSLELQLWLANIPSSTFNSSMVCHMPEQGTQLTDVDLSFCAPITSPAHPTYTSEKTTEQMTSILDRVNCVNEKQSSGQLYLEKIYQYFSVKQVEMGKVSVDISSPDATLSMVAINDNNEAVCRYDIYRQMTFDNLDQTSAHTFCLIKKDSYTTSPKNCFSFRFQDTRSIWGHDEIIIALVCTMVLSLIVGVLCGWLLSCRYQRFFKAKESVKYQSSERSTSRTVTEIEDFSSSITSDYRSGKYALDDGSKRLRRTYSDNSIISCKSYVTAVSPSPFEIIQWKLRKHAMSSNEYQLKDYLDKLEYDCLPPPLPPHPKRNNTEQIYETVGEPNYADSSEIVPYRILYA
ncbi:Leucine-rich repeat-containing protein 4C [Pseudolycoriella hygida]|uniref:Leucine-rich repeat-containing protein 4C n=1 Tax=Pseudolycoriella hygida TaxID=35572 RepID=A0A9Q0N3F3_9DIPT|nr:Leucine-rich repeat-containing protein 4C [Pseudolycoriella hygida]